ncbi:hypothetical protein AYL99_08618 [Fonsecaea erecta]|uniref:Uncharacterized protein n=1 Tax=Fonsecaea erecta TaxID=1367422 RepID=A0A178ZDI9_9EURO|nr:hypothetical protein AYL99_08618 [Fonsecaea erecta]OAP57880.1 hypothetical protein AYL99_08618 [Fonsecaea erecta]
MRVIRDKLARSLYTGDTPLRKFERLCRYCGSHLKAEIEAARDALHLNIPWRKCNVRKTAKHKYTLNMDDIYIYESEFVGESYRCVRNCTRSSCIRTDEEDADPDSVNSKDAGVGGLEDEASSMSSSMHGSTSSRVSRRYTSFTTVSSLDPMDEERSYHCESDSVDLASLHRQRHLSSPSFEESYHPAETPPWESLTLVSSSSDEWQSVFSRDRTGSGHTAYDEGASTQEDDSRICSPRCLDLENMEDWSIDGNGNLWPNEILRHTTVTLIGRAETQRR